MTYLESRLKVSSPLLKLPLDDKEQVRLLSKQYGFDEGPMEADDPYKFKKETLFERLNGKFGFSKKMLDLLPNGAVIVDIGAGNSLFDIAIAVAYRHKNFKFILVDGDQFDESKMVWADKLFNENGYQPYNDWAFVKKTIALNNLPLENFTFVSPADFKECNATLVMSHSSWCWHYPYEEYIDIVKAGLQPGGFFLLSPALNARNLKEKINQEFGNPFKFEMYTFRPGIDHGLKESQRIYDQINEGILDPINFKFFGIWQRAL